MDSLSVHGHARPLKYIFETKMTGIGDKAGLASTGQERRPQYETVKIIYWPHLMEARQVEALIALHTETQNT